MTNDPTPTVDEGRHAMSMGPEPPHFWEDRCVLCGYGAKNGALSLVHAECAGHVHETDAKPDPMGKARIMYQEEVAALREQIQELREDAERHKEAHGAACLLAWRIYAAAMSESVDTFQGVPGPDVVLAVEARIDNLCNDETRDPMWFKRAEKAEADLDELKQAARPFSTEEGVDSAGIEEIEALRALLDQGQDDKEKP